jgi:hypothetical protein
MRTTFTPGSALPLLSSTTTPEALVVGPAGVADGVGVGVEVAPPPGGVTPPLLPPQAANNNAPVAKTAGTYCFTTVLLHEASAHTPPF